MKNRFKNAISMLLVLTMLLCLAACGGSVGESASSETESEPPAVESAREPLTAPDYVQAAMDAAGRLTSGRYFLLEDGTILASDESYDGIAGDCAAVPGVRKLVDSCSEMELFALTESGELYFRDTKFLEGVTDAIYCTNNVNQAAVAAVGADIYKVYVSDYDPFEAGTNASGTVDAGQKTVHFYPITDQFLNPETKSAAPEGAQFVLVASDMHDYMALTDQGKLYLSREWEADELEGLTCGGWEDLILADCMLVRNADATEVTVAGIQADGTVLAEGAYAEDILSWGELAYISMNKGLIAGLGRDGTLKLAGPLAEQVAPETADWPALAAIRVGGDSRYGDMVLNAMDSQGVCYHLSWNEHGSITVTRATAEKGSENWWYKYSPDGSVTRSSGDNGAWEPYED